MQFSWLDKLVSLLVAGSKDQADGVGGVKIIDFSEVPSDILPLIISLVARLVFSIQQWTPSNQRHPIALFCDEAHLYIPEHQSTSAGESFAVSAFERIAKEGRKYGVGLVVISQRPSEVNRTVLSQCNNLVAMRLTNGDDQTVVKRLLPDSLGGFSDLLPVLDTGDPFLIALADRAKAVQECFEDRQTSTGAALADLLEAIRKDEQRKKEQAAKGLDGLTYFVLCKLTDDGIANADRASKKAGEAFARAIPN